MDDATPEPDETIEIRLDNPQGGAVLDPENDRATVVILANDVVGGVVGFASDSRSLIAQEGSFNILVPGLFVLNLYLVGAKVKAVKSSL